MGINDCITLTGLLLDIVGASLLAWVIVSRRPNSVVAEEGNWHQSSKEMVRSLKNSCDDFRNTVAGWGILCFGFILQIAGLANFNFAWLVIILFLIIIALLNFSIALVQQYKIEVAIEFILKKINYTVELSNDSNYGFTWPTLPDGENQNDIIIPIIFDFIDFPLYWDWDGGRDRYNLMKFIWLTNEIALRHSKFELPSLVYGDQYSKESKKTHKGLWCRALYWSICPHINGHKERTRHL